ncbi:MAG: hypothetical protein ACP5M9_01630 [Candidatus Micrarchaeia archaeon]
MARRGTQNIDDIEPENYNSGNINAHMKRMLHYKERHSGWHIFQSVYWGIFLFVFGIILILQPTLGYTVEFAAGLVLIILSLMVVIYGFVIALHLKLLKKYG